VLVLMLRGLDVVVSPDTPLTGATTTPLQRRKRRQKCRFFETKKGKVCVPCEIGVLLLAAALVNDCCTVLYEILRSCG